MDNSMKRTSGFSMSEAVKRTFAQIGQHYEEPQKTNETPIPATAQTEVNSARSVA